MKIESHPVCYQITVSNLTAIGLKTMSQFFVSFHSQTNSNVWRSPIVNGRIDKANHDYPWTFLADTGKLTVQFHSVAEEQGNIVVGTTPLFLLKKQGEEQFLVFGSLQSNRGRKVAEIQIQYCQCSLSKLSGGNSSMDKQADKDLNIIPEQSLRAEQLEDVNNFPSRKSLNPSKLQTLIYQRISNRQQASQLEIIQEMQDITDKWYRYKFGRAKPINLDQYNFGQQDDSIVQVTYQAPYKHLQKIDQNQGYLQLKKLFVDIDKDIKQIVIWHADFKQPVVKQSKILTISALGDCLKDLKAVVALPEGHQLFGVELVTTNRQKLKGLISVLQESKECRIEIYDEKGTAIGSLGYELKHIKNIEIQTVELMSQLQQAAPQQNLDNLDNQRYRSDKTHKNNIHNQKTGHNSPFRSKESSILSSKVEAGQQLERGIYLHQKWKSIIKESSKQSVAKKEIHPPEKITKSIEDDLKKQVAMKKHVYMNQSKHKFRKNKFELPKKQTINTEEKVNFCDTFNHPSSQEQPKNRYFSIQSSQKKTDRVISIPVIFTQREQKPSLNTIVSAPSTEERYLRKQTFPKESIQKQSNNSNKFTLQINKDPSFQEQPLRNPHKRKFCQDDRRVSIQQANEKSIVRLYTEPFEMKRASIKQHANLGVNTDRIAIVNNVLQSHYVPIIKTEGREIRQTSGSKASKQDKRSQQNIEQSSRFKTQQKSIASKEMSNLLYNQEQKGEGSDLNSSNQFINIRTKYSMKTIQPLTVEPKLNFMILTMSISCMKPLIGGLFAKLHVPNHYHYQTETQQNSQHLLWICRGFVFHHLLETQQLYLQLYHLSKKGVNCVGRTSISCSAFKSSKKQGIIRVSIYEDESQQQPVGEVIMTFQNTFKFNDLTEKNNSQRKNNHTAVELSLPKESYNPKEDPTALNDEAPPRGLVRNKRNKTVKSKKGRVERSNDPINKEYKNKKNRCLAKDFSKCEIDSRVNPIKMKKYSGGRNIAIGRDARLPFGYEQYYYRDGPGPGSYEPVSQFQRYSKDHNLR